MKFFDKQIQAKDLIGMPETLHEIRKNLNNQKRPSKS